MSSATKIAIIDYGIGNIRSVQNALKEIDVRARLVADPMQLENYDAFILPGVGAFEAAMVNLKKSGMDSALTRQVEKGKLLLGICLGMQLICRCSQEDGLHQGLGFIPAQVLPFPSRPGLKIPHMGWNSVSQKREHRMYHGVDDEADVYFVHSFYVECENEADIVGVTEHGVTFTSIVAHDNVVGFQFHPEKSQGTGLQFLRNTLTNVNMGQQC